MDAAISGIWLAGTALITRDRQAAPSHEQRRDPITAGAAAWNIPEITGAVRMVAHLPLHARYDNSVDIL